TPVAEATWVKREGLSVVQRLFAEPFTGAEVGARIRDDATLSEAVRQDALARVESFWQTRLRSDALKVVQPLFDVPLPRADVLERLRPAPPLSEPVRQQALELAQRYPQSLQRLDQYSYNVVWKPGAEAAKYRLALRQAEEACRLAPAQGEYLTTLGMAQY